MKENGDFGGKLTSLQWKVVKALIESSTIKEAAAVAGCSESSVYKWLKEPVFNAELLRLENQLRNATGRALAKDSGKALDVIRELMVNRQTEPGLRFRAACAWLDYTLKTQDYSELEARVAALEAKK